MKDVKILTDNGIDIQKSLELFGDMNTYDQMLEDFLSDVEVKLQNAKNYKETGDMANYAITVHSLKSDCKYFGIFGLADMYYEHELASKKNDSYFVNTNYDALMKETNKILQVLKRYMGVEIASGEAQYSSSQEPVGGTILVVDDSNLVRNFVQNIFSNKYKVAIANDGEEAISIISNTPSDKIMCVLLDLNMPHVDGFSVLNYFKSNNLFENIPVSIITGLDDSETITKAFTYPIVDMIQKPFNEYAIKNVVEKTIARKK